MKNRILFLFICITQVLVAQEITLKKGVVLDSISINDSIAETYAIYLPKDFSTEKAWPTVFVFDSQGRGGRAVQLFRKAAEEQGYIIAASNNIQEEETFINNVKVGTRLMSTVFNYFPVDKRGVYTAGFAEGAKVAGVLPAVFQNVQGVMAIGDSWINIDYINNQARFSFVGLAGYEDHNYNKIQETVFLLSKAGLNASLYPYNGSHEWPFNDIIYNALGNFTLQAMEKGLRPRDPAIVQTLYTEELGTVERYLRMMQPYKAFELLEIMEGKYSNYGKEDEIKRKQKEVRRSRLFRNQRRNYVDAEIKEAQTMEEYLYFFDQDVLSANFENIGWWNQQVKDLQEMQQGEDQAEAEMASRILGKFQSLTKIAFEELKKQKAGIDPLIFTAILQTVFDKEDPQGYFNIISLSGQDGDYYTALLYLEDLLKTGYDNMEALYNIPGTLDLKLSPEYNHLIKKYLGESKFYDTQ